MNAATMCENRTQRPDRHATPGEIADWLCAQVAEYLRVPLEAVSLDVPIVEFGIDSVHKAIIIGELADALEVQVEIRLLDVNTTLSVLAHLLASLTRGAGKAG